jgi:protoporphyrinogen oxidase
MRELVIIGGGLSGLAAAYELEQRGLPYTLIEVKGRLGGCLLSERRAGFVLDGGPFAFPAHADWSFLEDIGLADALFELKPERVAFKDGAQTLVDTLARRLRGEIITRMAVSSIGATSGGFTLCLENGLVWSARAVILAAPARHAERMLRTLAPEAALRLCDYRYDTITRVALGYRRDQIGESGPRLWDMGLPFYYETEHPARVPPQHVLVQVGVRYPLERTTPQAVISHLQRDLNWPQTPAVARVDYWPDADPVEPHMPGFAARMAAIRALLPERLALVGSDYDGLGLGERFAAGRAAATGR